MTIKKTLFYFMIALVIIYGQFFMNHGGVTDKPPFLGTQTITGESVNDQVNTGPGIIYFWSDWCGVCRSMQGAITRILKDYPGITVAVRSGGAEEIREYQQQQGFTWTTIADTDGKIGSRYAIKGVPTMFILDKQGHIRFVSVGYSFESSLRFKLWLAGL